MKIYISGCYGTGNVGDEAILASLIRIARASYTSPEIIVGSTDPKHTRRLHDVDKVIPNIEKDLFKWIKNIRSVDRIFLGGGSVIGGHFIYRHSVIVSIANFLRIPVGYVAVGTSIVKNESLRIRCIQNVDFITVRDSGSAEYVSQYVPTDMVNKVPDPAYYKNEDGVTGKEDSDTILVCGKYVSRGKTGFDINGLVEALNNISEEWKIELVPCHYTKDRPFCFEVSKKLSRQSEVIDKDLSHIKMQNKITQADLVVGVRLHSIIMSIRGVTPFVGISYHPKCANTLKEFGTSNYHKFGNINSNDLYLDIKSNLEQGVTKYLRRYSEKQSKRAASLFGVIEQESQYFPRGSRVNRLQVASLVSTVEYLLK